MLITAETKTSLRSAVWRRLARLDFATTRLEGTGAAPGDWDDGADVGWDVLAMAIGRLDTSTIVLDSILATTSTLPRIPSSPVSSRRIQAVPTRQTSSSGRPKSPRIQVVLPEALCQRLAELAESDSRTVSNMARVLIQEGVERLERLRAAQLEPTPHVTDRFREVLERQERQQPRRLRGAPRRLRLRRPSG